ncbi:MAG: hypothetical protein H6714_08875 [Myxococcales bacterium]|nr:hypothetical protein [Myxococcales bacterium]
MYLILRQWNLGRATSLLLGWPVTINIALLLIFASSLTAKQTPVAERFARRFGHQDLSPAEKRYCRSVTWAWILFFACNSLVIVSIALRGSLALWAVYTGIISYLAVGAMAAVEFLLRKYKFRRYGNVFCDRLIARLFPPFDH